MAKIMLEALDGDFGKIGDYDVKLQSGLGSVDKSSGGSESNICGLLVRDGTNHDGYARYRGIEYGKIDIVTWNNSGDVTSILTIWVTVGNFILLYDNQGFVCIPQG